MSALRPWAAQTRTELALSLRQGEQLLVAIGIPLLLLVFFSAIDVLPLDTPEPVDHLAPAILALAVMSSAMVSLGIATGFERQYGVLRRLGLTPLGRGRLIAAKICAVLVIEVLQIVVLGAAALALGWRPGSGLIGLPIALGLGTAAFAGLGLTIAGNLSGTASLAVANGLYVVLLLLGGIIFPLDELPGPVEAVARLLPSAALVDVTVGLFDGDGLFDGGSSGAWVVLVAWAIVTPVVAARTLRWDPA
ncbi:MAG: ABC transporter permease [Actinomycetota bacterium]|nr:ABC transporter permease [Actinomycetota bacterium]